MLVDVINVLLPDLEMRRDKLVVDIAKQRNSLFMMQSEILQKLADSSAEDMLEDDRLIETLETVKVETVRTKENLEMSEKTEGEINGKRNLHRPVAVRGSILYFAIVDMAAINEMYQNSLQYVMKLFNEALQKVSPSEFLDTYKLNAKLMETVTLDLYRKICIGLFEAHKIVYSFLICTGIRR